MNAGILTSGYAAPTMPNRLLGSPTAVRVPISFRQEWHPDVLSWTRRASNNGGRFSYPTLLALQTFCESIDAAGLRSRMLRLNLMCGDNLNAALVPLYVAGSSTGDRLGNASDTNSNFVSGDYAESAGLLGNGSTKSLDTGFSLNTAGIVTTGHMSFYTNAGNPGAERSLMGCLDAGFSQFFVLGVNAAQTGYENYWGGTLNIGAGPLASGAALVIGTRRSATAGQSFVNTTASSVFTTSVTPADPGRSVFIFIRNQGQTGVGSHNARCRGYSLGLSLTVAQANDYTSAMRAFATALGRTPA